MNCINCNKETTNPKFCSRSCAATYNNQKGLVPKRKAKGHNCKHCNKLIFTRNLICEEHKIDYKELTIGDYRQINSVKNKHPSWLHSHVRNFARSWLKHLTKLPCAKCGYAKHVELAHIKALKDFDDSVKLKDVNSESNVIQLCPNCHWEFDNLSRENWGLNSTVE